MLGSRLAEFALTIRHFLENVGGMWVLLRQTLYWTFVAPFHQKTEHRRHTFPLMEAIGNKSIVLVARVGAAFTAGLGTMQISDEVLALRTMSINPVGYLVAPRMIAILVM